MSVFFVLVHIEGVVVDFNVNAWMSFGVGGFPMHIVSVLLFIFVVGFSGMRRHVHVFFSP